VSIRICGCGVTGDGDMNGKKDTRRSLNKISTSTY